MSIFNLRSAKVGNDIEKIKREYPKLENTLDLKRGDSSEETNICIESIDDLLCLIDIVDHDIVVGQLDNGKPRAIYIYDDYME